MKVTMGRLRADSNPESNKKATQKLTLISNYPPIPCASPTSLTAESDYIPMGACGSSAAVSPCSSVSFSPSTRSPVIAAPPAVASPGFRIGQSQSSFTIRSPELERAHERERYGTPVSERVARTATAAPTTRCDRVPAHSEDLQRASLLLDEDVQESVADTYFMFEPLALTASTSSSSLRNKQSAAATPVVVQQPSPPAMPTPTHVQVPAAPTAGPPRSPRTPQAEMSDTYCDFSPADLRDLLASTAQFTSSNPPQPALSPLQTAQTPLQLHSPATPNAASPAPPLPAVRSTSTPTASANHSPPNLSRQSDSTAQSQQRVQSLNKGTPVPSPAPAPHQLITNAAHVSASASSFSPVVRSESQKSEAACESDGVYLNIGIESLRTDMKSPPSPAAINALFRSISLQSGGVQQPALSPTGGIGSDAPASAVLPAALSRARHLSALDSAKTGIQRGDRSISPHFPVPERPERTSVASVDSEPPSRLGTGVTGGRPSSASATGGEHRGSGGLLGNKSSCSRLGSGGGPTIAHISMMRPASMNASDRALATSGALLPAAEGEEHVRSATAMGSVSVSAAESQRSLEYVSLDLQPASSACGRRSGSGSGSASGSCSGSASGSVSASVSASDSVSASCSGSASAVGPQRAPDSDARFGAGSTVSAKSRSRLTGGLQSLFGRANDSSRDSSPHTSGKTHSNSTTGSNKIK